MKNKVKITALILALMVSMASIVGCSNNNSTSTEASVSSNVSTETSTESSIEESSISESSAEISSETTSTAENSISSSSAVDPAVEERSYNKDEQTKFQSTRILNYKYYPYNKTYYYKGNESTITIPEVFSECPHIKSDTVKEIIVPETVKTIPKNSFTGCPNLEKLVILNPDCEFDVTRSSGIGYLSEIENILPNNNVNIYLYCHSDKTPADKSGNRVIPKSLTSSTAKFFSANYSTLLIHDLAEESYE